MHEKVKKSQNLDSFLIIITVMFVNTGGEAVTNTVPLFTTVP